ncbi:potassium transporter TrkG [Buchnera aphidicola]|uniref:potassium transporter TrkG n=1 Tax=Buchnera aphidicola TaxID=9 RepID=UPI003463C463
MRFFLIFKIIGLLIILFSFTIWIPYILSLIYSDHIEKIFSMTFFISFFIGLLLWLPTRKIKSNIHTREGFMIVVLFWIVLGSIGSLPFIFYEKLNISITDAFFESFSGLTTTGSTTLIYLDLFPKSILFYRQMLQWLGGIGIVILFLVISPFLGINGMGLYKVEIASLFKNSKIMPRIHDIAKSLLYIYCFLTILCTLLFWIFGMSFFDAISHSLSTISIGGFSTHDSNIGYFNNQSINIITSLFLILSSCNYTLHFIFFKKRNIFTYWNDIEFKIFFYINFMVFIIFFLVLYLNQNNDFLLKFTNKVLFQIFFTESTAGFSIVNLSTYPSYCSMLLLLSACIGGCSGSMGGGIKVIRFILLYKQFSREIKRIIHPNALYNVNVGNIIFSTKALDTVWAFFFAYFLLFFLGILSLIFTGIDAFSSCAAIISSLNNLGLGLGVVVDNFKYINNTAKWILILMMIFGRLEIFTLLVILSPTFWKTCIINKK